VAGRGWDFGFRIWNWGFEVEGGGEELILLQQMDGEGAGGGGGGGAAAGVADFLSEEGAEPGLEMVPGAHIAGLLLAPDDLRVAGVFGYRSLKLFLMQRIDLFQTDDGGVPETVFFAELRKVVVNLAGAKNDATGARGHGGIGQNFLKTAAGTVLDWAGGTGIAQHALRGHNHEGLDGFPKGLATEEMEVVGGGGGISDNPVVFGAELQEAFEPGAGVFRALAVVAVGKKQGDAGGDTPLRFRGGDVLVDLGLGAVGKIAELGLPEDEHFGAVERVAVVEPEDGGFGEWAVVHAKGGLVLREIFQRDVAGPGAEVVNGGVALAEGAAAAVLAGETDGMALNEEGSKREVFGPGPVESRLPLGHGPSVIEHLADLSVDLEITRDGGNGAAQFGEGGAGDSGGSFLEKSRATKIGTEFGLEAGGGFAGFAEGVF